MDHLVFGAPDLASGVAYIEKHLGVSTQPGGRHEGFGTHNRLIGLGARSYMEVVCADPDQPTPDRPRWFGLDTLARPELVTWCWAAPNLEECVTAARALGLELGEIREGSRRTESGDLLSWRMTDPWADRAGGVVPFFIDWGESVHPGGMLTAQGEVIEMRGSHPEAERISSILHALGVDMIVTAGQVPSVRALLRTSKGDVELC